MKAIIHNQSADKPIVEMGRERVYFLYVALTIYEIKKTVELFQFRKSKHSGIRKKKKTKVVHRFQYLKKKT